MKKLSHTAILLALIVVTGCTLRQIDTAQVETPVHRDLTNMQITDLTPIKGLQIHRLDLTYNFNLTNITPLRGMPLDSLCLNQTSVQDIAPLRGMPLSWLLLHKTPVDDISTLRGMPLEHLMISDTRVTDISPLEGMRLQSLDMRNAPVKTGFAVLGAMPLKDLEMTGSNVTSWSFLDDLSLDVLVVDGGRDLDLAKLATKTFRELELSSMGISNLNDLVGIQFRGRSRINLNLSLHDNRVSDIRSLPKLIRDGCAGDRTDAFLLDLTGNPISNFAPLDELPDFVEVYLDPNQLDLAKKQIRSTDRLRSGLHGGTSMGFHRFADMKDAEWWRHIAKESNKVLDATRD